MHRRTPLACLLAGLVLSLGCASCASPWDYCGPVYAGGACNSCVVDDRMGSAFTGGPDSYSVDEMGGEYYEGEGPYEGEGSFEGESAPYDEPMQRGAEPVPTPAEDNEPTPDDTEPRSITPPDSTPMEPPTVDESTPPDTMLPPGGSDAMPPLEAPPSEGRRTSFTAPVKKAESVKKPAPLKKPERAKPPTVKPIEQAKDSDQAASGKAVSAPAAANAPAKAGAWQPARPKSKFRR